MRTSAARTQSYGEARAPTLVDRFGVWLSSRAIRKVMGRADGLAVADFGCGFNATFSRSILPRVASLLLVDVSLAPDLQPNAKVRAVEGLLPDSLLQLPSDAIDVIVCNNVIEHLWQPQETLEQIHRLLRPGGKAFVNVPSWKGKTYLEFAAFRLHVAPADEMNDHKMYYDPRDLWPLLVRAGFRPQDIKVKTHKFGLNTYGSCIKRQ
jgi:SAM-dependent methyltransferase